MYRNQKKKGKKKERSKTSLNSLALRNARTFRLLSLRVRCIRNRLFLVGDGGFEPPKAKPADLQSVPFGHSGNLPYLI